MDNNRKKLLKIWADQIWEAAGKGALGKGPLRISDIQLVAGPRAGAIQMLAGLDAGKLLRAFTRSNSAVLRQFIPWKFCGEPVIFMAGRYVRIEAGWSDELAQTMIRLGDLGSRPKNNGRWVAGRSEGGKTIVPGLNDKTPHFLLSGCTGSGKSIALQSAVLQLSQDPNNSLVLADGKFGESLSKVSHLAGVVGPVAVDGPGVRAALGWACRQMRQRYENRDYQGRVIVAIDEFQEWAGDKVFVDLVRKIASQGRAAGVHLLMSTQFPNVRSFGDPSVRRNLSGKLALRVDDFDASRVATGGNSARADFLLGAGDAYTIAPDAIHRIQGAFVDEREIGKAGNGQHLFDAWPEYEAEDVGQNLPQAGRPRRALTHAEIGASLIAAMKGEGRPAFKTRLEAEGLSRPGSDRARALMGLGRQVKDWLENHDVTLCYLDGDGQEWGIEAD